MKLVGYQEKRLWPEYLSLSHELHLTKNHQNSTFFTNSDILLQLAYMADVREKDLLKKSLQKKKETFCNGLKNLVKKQSLYKSGLKSDNLELFGAMYFYFLILKLWLKKYISKTNPTNAKNCFF